MPLRAVIVWPRASLGWEPLPYPITVFESGDGGASMLIRFGCRRFPPTFSLAISTILYLTTAGYLALSQNQGETRYDVMLSRDVMVPMRDGVRLATDIHRPAINGVPTPTKFPVI